MIIPQQLHLEGQANSRVSGPRADEKGEHELSGSREYWRCPNVKGPTIRMVGDRGMTTSARIEVLKETGASAGQRRAGPQTTTLAQDNKPLGGIRLNTVTTRSSGYEVAGWRSSRQGC